jgi:hypothetical protein
LREITERARVSADYADYADFSVLYRYGLESDEASAGAKRQPFAAIPYSSLNQQGSEKSAQSA